MKTRDSCQAQRSALYALALAVLVLLVTGSSLARAAAIPVNVPVNSVNSAASYQAPWLAVNPTNPLKLAVSFQDQSGTDCWLGLSNDGGATWTQVNLVGPAGQNALETLPTGLTNCFRASIAYGPDGRLYYAFTASQPGTPAYDTVFVTSSTDGGQTFDTPVAFDNQPLLSGNVNDQIPRMAVDPATGRLYVAWQQVTGRFTSESSFVASSTDHGQTFSSPVEVSPASDNVGPSFPTVAPGGRLYVAMFDVSPIAFDDPTQPSSILMVSSTNDGATFSAPVTAQQEYDCTNHGPDACPSSIPVPVNSNAPSFAVGPSGNDLFLVSYGLVDNIFRVRFTVSHDGGATWSPDEDLGIPAGSEGHEQILPSISMAPSGRLDIVYYDLDPITLEENTYLISSNDGGATFSTPQLLSSAPSNTTIKPVSGGFGNSPFPGSQMVAATNDATYTAWTDSRRAITPNEEDIFSAAVTWPTPSITITAPASSATYTQGQAVTAAYSCAAPAGDPVTACAGPVATGAAIDTSTLGQHTFTVNAGTADGPTASQTVTYSVVAPAPVLVVAPVVSRVSESATTWREGNALARISAVKNRRLAVGTTFRFTLNEAATVTFAFSEKRAGRRVGGRCVAPAKRNRSKSGCTRVTAAAKLVFAARQGADRVSFDGRVSRTRKLAPGRYAVTITATNAHGQRSAPRTLSFTIVTRFRMYGRRPRPGPGGDVVTGGDRVVIRGAGAEAGDDERGAHADLERSGSAGERAGRRAEGTRRAQPDGLASAAAARVDPAAARLDGEVTGAVA